ncbi:MAG: hypothetical protein WBA16_11565 [Nonlabens sp.]
MKNLFDKRKIDPSSDAWDKLSSKLDAADDKQQPKAFVWLGAVAAAVAVLFVMTFVLQTTENPESELVYEAPESIREDHDGQLNELTQTPYQPQASDAVAVEMEKNIKPDHEEPVATMANSKPLVVVKATPVNNTTDLVASNKPGNQRSKVDPLLKVISIDSIEVNQMKPQGHNTQVTIADSGNEIQTVPKFKSTTDKEIEALLIKALNEIQTKNSIHVTENTRPLQLLREAEWDLEYDRRHRINKSLKGGILQIKTDAYALIGIKRN